MRGILRELAGQRFGRLLAVHRTAGKSYETSAIWLCKCDCGNECDVTGRNLFVGKAKICGCIRREGNMRLRPYEASYNALVSSRNSGRKVTITYEEFLQFTGRPCHYCTVCIDWKPYGDWNYHLDRMDNAIDYIAGNCVACCKRCNYGKNKYFTYDEWWAMTEIFRRKACQT